MCCCIYFIISSMGAVLLSYNWRVGFSNILFHVAVNLCEMYPFISMRGGPLPCLWPELSVSASMTHPLSSPAKLGVMGFRAPLTMYGFCTETAEIMNNKRDNPAATTASPAALILVSPLMEFQREATTASCCCRNKYIRLHSKRE